MSLKSREDDLIAKIEQDLRMQHAHGLKKNRVLFGGEWEGKVKNWARMFINKDFSVSKEAMRNFRALMFFILDVPTRNGSGKGAVSRSYALQFARERAELLFLYEIAGAMRLGPVSVLDFLKKYPCNLVGNPNVFSYKGCSYTRRWWMRIWHLILFRHFLQPCLGTSFRLLDIGSNYGIFSYLLKQEYPNCSQILVDFPESLVLAHYYLGLSFPNARIASYKEVAKAAIIDKNFINKYDFILLPISFYNAVERNSIDVVSSISSLGEMSRKGFRYYMESEPFLSVQYFFCMLNQIKSAYYNTDLTIADYRLEEFQTLHFRLVELLPYEKRPKKSETLYFEFIGKRN